MKAPDNHEDSASRDLENQLSARLRDTTPEFEHHFDDMRRRLALEPPLRGWRALGPFGAGRAWRSWALFSLSSTAAAVLIVMLWHPGAHDSRELTAAQTAAFGEMVALDDTLRDALPLTDPETLDALLSLSTSNPG